MGNLKKIGGLMKIKKEKVSILSEVILFNDEKEKVIILSKGKIQQEFKGVKIIPIYAHGRLIELMMEYQGEYYKSFVIGKDKQITSIGYVLGNISDDEIFKDIQDGNISIVDTEDASKTILLFFDGE